MTTICKRGWTVFGDDLVIIGNILQSLAGVEGVGVLLIIVNTSAGLKASCSMLA
jgi:hypothetical protein